MIDSIVGQEITDQSVVFNASVDQSVDILGIDIMTVLYKYYTGSGIDVESYDYQAIITNETATGIWYDLVFVKRSNVGHIEKMLTFHIVISNDEDAEPSISHFYSLRN